MKKYGILLMVMCFMAGAVLAEDSNWNVESGYWSDGANWALGRVPLATDGYINIRQGAASVCTLNTDEGLFSSRLMMQNGQTLNIEDGGRFGTKWSRVGRNTAAYVNMTGNGTFVMNDDDLYIGLEGGSAEWKMFDSSSLMVQADDGDDGEELHVGYNNGYGLLQLNGSGITVNVDRIHFSNRADQGDPASTLEFVLDASGVSTIIAQRTYIAEAGTADLLLTDPGVTLTAEDIVLIASTGSYSIGGAGVFNSLNGGSASEGTLIALGGNLYSLTYAYEANADGVLNDVALVLVPEPATLALLSMGAAALLRRKR